MKYYTPVRTITTNDGSSVKPFFETLVANVPTTKLFKPFPNIAKFPNAKIFSKGNAALSIIEDAIPLFRYEPYYFCVVELDEIENKIYISLHNFQYRKTEEFLEQFNPLIEPLTTLPVNISEWQEAREIPKRLLSNGFTFMKSRGVKGFLL